MPGKPGPGWAMKAAAAGLGGLAALVLLIPMEAGVPIPVPADLVMFTVGERVAAGASPLWLAVAGFEVISVVGTTALFLAFRGPAHPPHRPVRPTGRADRGADPPRGRVRRGARPAGAGHRARTPGLRTVTVLAAGASGLSARRALPALILGSSVFLQLHLVLGLLLGPLADRAFNQAKGPALIALVVPAAAALVFRRLRRGKRAASEAWAEAACPACLGLNLVAERALAGLRPDRSASRTTAPRRLS